MDRRKQSDTSCQPDLFVRDTLRGLRHAVRKTTHFIADEDNRLFPKPISDITSPVLRKFDGLSQQIEDMSSSMIGGPIRKARLPDAAFFGAEGYDPHDPDRSPQEAGSALYYGLSWAARQLGSDTLLISETICLECMKHLKRDMEPRSAAALAERLACSILDRRVFRRLPFRSTTPQDARSRIVVGAAYTCALWFFVPRGIGGVQEEELMEICCTVTKDHLDQILTIRAESGSTEALFEDLLAIV